MQWCARFIVLVSWLWLLVGGCRFSAPSAEDYVLVSGSGESGMSTGGVVEEGSSTGGMQSEGSAGEGSTTATTGESVTCDDDCTFVACGDGSLNETFGEPCVRVVAA